MFWIILGWVLWTLLAVLSIGLVLSANRDGGVRFIVRTQGLFLAIGLFVTVAFPVSKFHLLWMFPVAFVIPLLIMQLRVAFGMRRVHSMINDARTQVDGSEAESLESLKAKLARAQRDLELLEDPSTIFLFGQMSYEGDGVEQSYTEAVGWFKIAAEQGNAKAAHNLGLMYEQGDGIARDLAEAAKWYEFGAKAGNAASQNNLATLFETGQGVAQDLVKAASLYQQAALNGDANAIPNLKRLTEVLKQAAASGNRTALELLEQIALGFRNARAD